MTMIDSFLPHYHFAERHRRRLAAPPATAAAELRAVELTQSALIRTLFALRGVPVGTLGSMFSSGFAMLQDDPARDLRGPLNLRRWPMAAAAASLISYGFRHWSRWSTARSA